MNKKIRLRKNRVHHLEDIVDTVERIPFLKKFFRKNETNIEATCRINKYIGSDYGVMRDNGGFSSRRMNGVLIEAEKRGDI